MEPKILRTYNNVWKVEKVLYGIQDIPLPLPITYRQIGFFIGGVTLVWLLNLFPPLSLLHLGLVEYVFLPGVVAWFFTKQHIDGKVPHRFIFRFILYHIESRVQNRYKEVSIIKKPYQYTSKIGYRQLSFHKRSAPDEDRISD
ncbi:conjugal transfer protein [Alkalihalobacillus sp. TS-13]|uniref:conjugal transfer protein n=1 Tax=Alkalihalobacillus sp. TS-13 TaxID=2842455 RepID=UPI001C87FBB2|nr:conjugal transfer protein [Alkalihalobacillus sp. TS-13]